MTNFLIGLGLGLLIWGVKELLASIKQKKANKTSGGGTPSGTKYVQ